MQAMMQWCEGDGVVEGVSAVGCLRERYGAAESGRAGE